jgi:dihydrofolate synthase / folylpolyglutamate synthase
MPDHDSRAGRDIPFPGEPGIEMDARPPFIADSPATRWLFALNRKGIRPGLGRVRGLLTDLGHPEDSLRTIVTAGTNGKGSTTRILARLLQDAGYRVGCYTSPHLLRVYERLSIDDVPIEPDEFTAMIERLQPSIDKHQASWFESLTAISIALCRDRGVDVLCCETGLGGRLDASNALPAMATLLTGVSLDHQHILGETLEEIAAEKLGLLKAGVPLFTAVGEDLKSQVFGAAIEAGSPCHFMDELTVIEQEPGRDRWRLTTRHSVFDDLPILGAPVMQRNAALAILTLEELAKHHDLALPTDIPASLERLFLPGRLQPVLREPAVYIDTAHNEEALCRVLETFLDRECAGRRIVLFGNMADKDPGDRPGRLLAECDMVLSASVSLPRARNREALSLLMDRWRLTAADYPQMHASITDALAYLAEIVQADDTVLICGSCFMAAEALYDMGVRDLEETRTIRDAGPVFARILRRNNHE